MCSRENGKYVESIIGDSVIMCDEIIKETKTIPTKSTSTNFYILLAFLLSTISLLIAVSVYCYLIKYKNKTKLFITISLHVIKMENNDKLKDTRKWWLF